MVNLLFCNLFFLKIAKELRDGVYEETGLTCSAGVAPNRLLAKVFRIFFLNDITLICINILSTWHTGSVHFTDKINVEGYLMLSS